MEFETQSLDILIKCIKNNDKMGFLRFGDGCIMMMFRENINRTIGHSNKVHVTPEVHEKMKKAYLFEAANCIVGSCMAQANASTHNTSSNINTALYKSNGLDSVDTRKHISYICIQECFLNNPPKFIEFIKTINNKRTIFCCQYYDKILEKYYGKIVKYIKVPKFNATTALPEIKKQILEIDPEDYDQIIFCCGQASRILIYELWNKLDKKLIDVGSLSDQLISNVPEIFNNIALRSHIRKGRQKIQQLVKYYNERI